MAMAKKQPRRWMYSPPRPAKPAVPETLKAEVEAKARELIDTVLKPRHIEPPPKDPRWNYIIDLGAKWYRNYFYFSSTYACPGPNALSPTFESKFARMEYVGDNRFNLAYMRHTGKWWKVFQGLTSDECLDMIRDEGLFQP
jgi:hypothetical protein